LLPRGFGDLPWIRDQRRPALFEPAQRIEPPLAAQVFELSGRLGSDGGELEPLRRDEVRAIAAQMAASGIEVAAVALLHASVSPCHERQVAEWLRAEGVRQVVLSSDVAPVIRLLPRAETTAADAYLAPLMRSFVDRLAEPLAGGRLQMMTSAGGLVPAAGFRPKDSLLSGPAGGLVGAAAAARAAGFDRVISFDMGGTSTDVARIDGPFRYRYEQSVGPARVLAPAMRIETVAAGGGSVCRWRNGALEVGPDSAGSIPGPACYGGGGPLTVTDVNLLLGLMDEGKAGIPLDREAARRRLDEMCAAIEEDGEPVPARVELLDGLRRIAVERMAEAIRTVSVREGYAPADHVLVAFGGAGPQHACAVAERLGISRVLVPADAGLLSARGLEMARRQEQRVGQLLRPLAAVVEALPGRWRELAGEARAALGIPDPELRHLVEMRLLGQDSTLELEVDDPACPRDRLEQRFGEAYRARYGYPPPPDRPIEVVNLRVVAEQAPAEVGRERFGAARRGGPRIRQDRFRTCVIGDGWSVCEGDRGSMLLERAGPAAGPAAPSPEAVEAGLFRSRFAGIVSDCGELLRRCALSTNVKERLDYSCALLDAAGRLVMNAPHVPVHLGALGDCVRQLERRLSAGPGDVLVVNHPAFGGSHLPDVTVVAAAHDAHGRLLGWLANRAHHAEIGGTTPGSMPADASRLADEGTVIPPLKLVEAGRPHFGRVERLLRGGQHPSRRVADNLADLEAQVAAVFHGVAMLEGLAERHGGEVLRRRLAAIHDGSARLMRRMLGCRGRWSASRRETLDDGSPLAVSITVRNGRMRVDFSGSGGVHGGNLNATPGIVRSVLLYVLRLWLGEDVPLNEGLVDPVEIVLPPGMLNPPFVADAGACPAVVGGNVETSQQLADLLCAALGICAPGPGTMNNLLFGNADFGYYETIGGGGGAGAGFDGASGRHVHMTNTAITDPEVLESRYPVRLREFALRRGSGGGGRWTGGDGLVREIEFLAPLTVSLLTQRRRHPAAGLEGGGAGAVGRQFRLTADGGVEALPGVVSYQAESGERLRVETPGGGGWGRP
jgi:5-oxoprolinase (ATP-hydrolysing)